MGHASKDEETIQVTHVIDKFEERFNELKLPGPANGELLVFLEVEEG